MRALRNRMDSSNKVFGAFQEVARVSVQLAEGLDSSRERADAIERASGQLAEAQAAIDARAAEEGERLLKEIGELRRSVEILSSLASDG